MMSCETCKYTTPALDVQNKVAFNCHRNAPVTKLIETYDGHWTPACFPTVYSDMWCGEYKQKDNTKPSEAE